MSSTSVTTFGLPMTPDVASLESLNNMFRQGSSCTLIIMTDLELVDALNYYMEQVAEQYETLRNRVRDEFAITMPSVEKCASVGAWLAQIASACFEALLDGLVAIAECVGSMVGAIVGGLFSGLGMGGTLILVLVGVVCLVIFL